MAEVELGTGIGGDDESTSPWSALPEEVQRMVLSHLPMKSLCRMRCVCKEWRRVVHRRDFRTMYDAVHESQQRSPTIFYVESSYPARLVLSSYDFAAKRWERMSGFTSSPRLEFDPLQRGDWPRDTWPTNVFSVGGLLCLHFWKMDRNSEEQLGVSSWVVWQPFRNIWKKLPPCNEKTRNRSELFVHAWVSDAGAKTYKLLMAHDSRTEGPDNMNSSNSVTEIYDSATGAWTFGSKFNSQPPVPHSGAELMRRGVLCNGVIYFCSGSKPSVYSVLLSYDIHRDQWHEEAWTRNRGLIFEWDGRLMLVKSSVDDGEFFRAFQFQEEDRQYVLEERNPNSGMWTETGTEIPFKVRRKFDIDDVPITVVARGNDLAITSYDDHDTFRIAVYKRAEDYWRLPPTGTFLDKFKYAQVEGLVLHKPHLGWIP